MSPGSSYQIIIRPNNIIFLCFGLDFLSNFNTSVTIMFNRMRLGRRFRWVLPLTLNMWTYWMLFTHMHWELQPWGHLLPSGPRDELWPSSLHRVNHKNHNPFWIQLLWDRREACPTPPYTMLSATSPPPLRVVHALLCKSNHPPALFVLQMASPTSFYIHTPTTELWGPSRK